MQVEVKIDPDARETRVIVVTDEMSEEVGELIQRLSQQRPQMLAGFREGQLAILEPSELLRVYAAGGKVYAVTERGKFTLRQRLYEMEERLGQGQFARISHAEIINLKKVRSFDLSLTGTICVCLTDGTVTYVSRRYVPQIKRILGI